MSYNPPSSFNTIRDFPFVILRRAGYPSSAQVNKLFVGLTATVHRPTTAANSFRIATQQDSALSLDMATIS